MKPIELKTLPDVLTMRDGRAIETKDDWEALRRPEIMTFFTEQVYGICPPRPQNLRFERLSSAPTLGGEATLEVLEASFTGPYGAFAFPFVLFLPKQDVSCPATLFICNRSKEENMDLTRRVRSDFWPVEQIVARGYAACAFFVGDIDIDADDGSVHGVQPCFTPERGENDWGTIAAWAWGAMRVMDYLQTEVRIDPKRISIVGQSRGGKTSLLCAACDERFSAVFSNCSGCVGTSPSHFKHGETIRQINEVFPYWFCDAFKRYNNRDEEIPFDQHELMACIAPRLLYVTGATLDDWSDPDAAYAATKLCAAAYRLYGMTGVPEEEKTPLHLPVCGSGVGFHNRVGVHDLTSYDWMRFLDFLDERQ